ncbi:MAG: hypothetical protein M3069_19990 [Chloroflexota bacterium]|nr:hypothetical protein [Chloroflexota bacterium]
MAVGREFGFAEDKLNPVGGAMRSGIRLVLAAR